MQPTDWDDLSPYETQPSAKPATNTPSDLWLSPADVVEQLAQAGDPVPTGIPFLDSRMRRGGLPPGRIFTVGGPPYTGKTTLLAEAALRMSEHVPVFALFTDEGRAQASIRIGTLLGIPIEEIEERPDLAGAMIRERLGHRRLTLLKPESDFANAAYVYDYAAENSDGKTGVALFDSVQTIPANADDDRTDERMGIKSFMRLARSKTERHGLISILSSQSNRGFYRSRKKDENTVALASFLGDSSIEYLSDLILVLNLPDKESQILDAEFAKNRLKPFRRPGSPPYTASLSLRYDEATAGIAEVQPETVAQADADAASAKLRPTCDAITAALKGIAERSGAEIERRLRGKGAGTGTRAIRAALELLVARGTVTELFREGRGGGYFYALKNN